jgi:hypothetical protein
LSTAAIATVSTNHHQHHDRRVTRLDYWHHDPNDFDVYIRNPTAEDLPKLLHKFDEEGLEVWPWIWIHPNANGPHHVYVGLDSSTVEEIIRIRAASPNHNILIIADQATLDEATAQYPPGILADCHCGLVTDVGNSIALCNTDAKLIMLQDERVIAYDHLTVVNSPIHEERK